MKTQYSNCKYTWGSNVIIRAQLVGFEPCPPTITTITFPITSKYVLSWIFYFCIHIIKLLFFCCVWFILSCSLLPPALIYDAAVWFDGSG